MYGIKNEIIASVQNRMNVLLERSSRTPYFGREGKDIVQEAVEGHITIAPKLKDCGKVFFKDTFPLQKDSQDSGLRKIEAIMNRRSCIRIFK